MLPQPAACGAARCVAVAGVIIIAGGGGGGGAFAGAGSLVQW
jgi:hypothetical protein